MDDVSFFFLVAQTFLFNLRKARHRQQHPNTQGYQTSGLAVEGAAFFASFTLANSAFAADQIRSSRNGAVEYIS